MTRYHTLFPVQMNEWYGKCVKRRSKVAVQKLNTSLQSLFFSYADTCEYSMFYDNPRCVYTQYSCPGSYNHAAFLPSQQFLFYFSESTILDTHFRVNLCNWLFILSRPYQFAAFNEWFIKLKLKITFFYDYFGNSTPNIILSN